MKVFVVCTVLLTLAAGAAAQETPLIYAKTILRIVPTANSKPPPSPTKGESGAAAEVLPSLARAPKEFTVELRPLSFLSQPDFLAHQPFADREGMLILVSPPGRAALSAGTLLATVDALFLAPDGRILQIAPSVNLTRLDEPLKSAGAVRAFLFLKSGETKADDIQPGDRVENALFKAQPVVLQEPSPTPMAPGK